MIRGIIFDLGGTLMYFGADWEAVDKVCVANLVTFLSSKNITTGDDFYEHFLDHRKRQWKRAEEIGVEARVKTRCMTRLPRADTICAMGC